MPPAQAGLSQRQPGTFLAAWIHRDTVAAGSCWTARHRLHGWPEGAAGRYRGGMQGTRRRGHEANLAVRWHVGKVLQLAEGAAALCCMGMLAARSCWQGIRSLPLTCQPGNIQQCPQLQVQQKWSAEALAAAGTEGQQRQCLFKRLETAAVPREVRSTSACGCLPQTDANGPAGWCAAHPCRPGTQCLSQASQAMHTRYRVGHLPAAQALTL